VVEGGESTVTLPSDHGRGGRNQQTILAAIAAMRSGGGWPAGALVESLGTDGEDGPTDAAGALADADVAAAIAAAGLDLETALTRRDAYPLLARAGGLVVTGPTGTNVADLRLILAAPADDLTRRTGSRPA
ncbi:MAG: MOFRL family protein, partial [Planctomycetia bacterium]